MLNSIHLKSSQLGEILATRIKFEERPFEEKDLCVDLVVKLEVPEQEYLSRSADVPLTKFILNPSPELERAYAKVYEDILKQMLINDKHEQLEQNKIWNMRSFKRIDGSDFKQVPKNLFTEDKQKEEVMMLNCKEKFEAGGDLFSLKYNTLVYVLQTKCGFRVRSFLDQSERGKEIYLLLSQETQNLLRIAHQYRIKKQVDYVQLDFYLNDPVDNSSRPIRLNSSITKDRQLTRRRKRRSKAFLIDDSKSVRPLVNEEALTKAKIQQFLRYEDDQDQTFHLLQEQKYPLSLQEKSFLLEFNRRKFNDGCAQEYIRVKNRREYFRRMKMRLKELGYQIWNEPQAYMQFRLPSKSNSFFGKLRDILLYKQTIVSAFGDISLFNSMERIKLSYLSLSKHVRVGHIAGIGGEVFALNDPWELYGMAPDSKRLVKTRMPNGQLIRYLAYEWSIFKPWRLDIKQVRNYLGDKVAYNIYLKSYLVLLFLILAPFGVVIELLNQLLGPSMSHLASELIFSFANLALIVVVLSAIREEWFFKQKVFLNNFIEITALKTPRYGYKGAYVRNLVSDNLNDHASVFSLSNYLKEFVSTIMLVGVIVLQGVFFYGTRQIIVSIYSYFPAQSFYAFSLPHFICYGGFFGINFLLDQFILERLRVRLSLWRNYPSEEEHDASLETSMLLSSFGLQLLGPLFFLVIEPFSHTSCYSSECIQEIRIYIYARYSLLFISQIVYLATNLWKYSLPSHINRREGAYQQVTYQFRLSRVLERVFHEGSLPKLQLSMREEMRVAFLFSFFTMIFPFSSLLAAVVLLIYTWLTRSRALWHCQRPLNRTTGLQTYSNIFTISLYLTIFFNAWIIIFLHEFVEYEMVSLIRSVILVPTQQSILLLKIAAVCITAIGYLILGLVTCAIVRSQSNRVLQERKNIKVGNFLANKLSKFAKNTLKVDLQPVKHPIKTIFRVFNLDNPQEGNSLPSTNRNSLPSTNRN